jgi:hypothetical protein
LIATNDVTTGDPNSYELNALCIVPYDNDDDDDDDDDDGNDKY